MTSMLVKFEQPEQVVDFVNTLSHYDSRIPSSYQYASFIYRITSLDDMIVAPYGLKIPYPNHEVTIKIS